MNRIFDENCHVRIREERKKLGLTQAQAAEKCGVKVQQWNRYENNKSVLDGAALRAFISIGADGQYILSGQRTSIDGTEVTIEALDAIDRSVVKLMAERQAELKRTIDQCMNYKKLMMVRYVLDMNDADFAVFYDGVKRMESDVPVERESKVAASFISQPMHTGSGDQYNAETQNFDNRSPVGQNIQGDVKIKSKGKRSQAAFNISNNEK